MKRSKWNRLMLCLAALSHIEFRLR